MDNRIIISKKSILQFQNNLLEFYSQAEELKPWKTDTNPYKIWVFEVVMQQTRMAQGIPFYERLLAKFPTIADLANASEDQLFSVWKGLGYYSRARNLQFSAKYIVNDLNGNFPQTYHDCLRLKGVGEYTAAAISSFAFGEDIAVLDGNVHRFLSRFFGIEKTIQSTTDKKYFQTLASELLVSGQSAIFNQAMMDMGSVVCKPQNPLCQDCSFSNQCIAYQSETIKNFPPKKIRLVLKERHFYCLFVHYKGKIYLEKRTENDVWRGLYQGIIQEGKEIVPEYWAAKSLDMASVLWSEWQIQVLSHQKIFMKMALYQFKKSNLKKENFIELHEIHHWAMPRIVSKWLEKEITRRDEGQK